MERIGRILDHPLYREAYQKIEEHEKDRIYCCHDMEHFLAVARLAYIKVLEEDRKINKELLYAASLLHDIGRAKEYEEKISHDEAGIELSEIILSDCGFSKEEKKEILRAVGGHRGFEPSNQGGKKTMADLLQWADKKSRNCMVCRASKTCKWQEEQKNKTVTE